MKKILAFCSLFLLLAGYGFAQFEKPVEFGFQASPLVAFPTITDSSKKDIAGLDTKARMGFSFGLVTNIRIADPVAFSTGLHIATRGFGTAQTITNPLDSTASLTLNSKRNFTSVMIPIGLRFRSPELGSSGMHIMGKFGGDAELNVQTVNTYDVLTVDAANNSVTVTEDSDRDADNINLFTFSFVPGAGVDWVQDWGTVSGGFSYHWGLMNILDKDRNGGNRARLNYVALDLAYYF